MDACSNAVEYLTKIKQDVKAIGGAILGEPIVIELTIMAELTFTIHRSKREISEKASKSSYRKYSDGPRSTCARETADDR